MSGDDRLRRLSWLCRRGMKELDLMLGGFIDRHREVLSLGGFPELEDFLNEEDDLIWTWLQGGNSPENSRYRDLISIIRGAE